MPLRSVLVAMVIHAPKNLLGAASRPVVATGRDGGIVGRPLPCHSLALWVLLRCCAWPCVGRALMPGGYGFDASGSILVQCVPQDGSKSSWVLSSSDAESRLAYKRPLSSLVRLSLALLP